MINTDFKTEFYYNTFPRRITENAIIDFYEKKQGYIVLHIYDTLIKEFNNEGQNKLKELGVKEIKQETIDLFKKYDSGYPDLILIKDGTFKFIEIKINTDGLSIAQVNFLLELKEIENITLGFFYNTKEYEKKSQGRKRSPKVKQHKDFKKEVRFLDNIRKTRGYKPFWTVAKITEKFDKRVKTESYLNLISSVTGISAKQIKWYYNKNQKLFSTE